MSFAPAYLVALLFFGSQDAQSQANPSSAAAEAAIRVAMNPTLGSSCFQAPADNSAALNLKVEPLPLSRLLLATHPDEASEPRKIGAFTYLDRGNIMTSDDARFSVLVVDAKLAVLASPDGNSLPTWNLVHASNGGFCRLALTRNKPSLDVKAFRHDTADGLPFIPGFRLGASWSLGDDRFIGVMNPETGVDRTLFVSFATSDPVNVHVEADIPVAFQAVRTIVRVHGGPLTIYAIGRQSDGTVIQAQLRADSLSQ